MPYKADTMSDATSLAAQQNAMLSAIFTKKNIAVTSINTPAKSIIDTKNRGLITYQANASALAVRSLLSSFPVIAQLIGKQAFELLAHDFLAQQPPQRGDIAQWGGDLPVFIASISALQTEPYLSDVARVEWALHTAATAADQTADLSTFSLLTTHDPEDISLQLAPGTVLISSLYPVASILTAHLYAQPAFEEAGQKIRDNIPEIALVWRQGLRPRVAVCGASDSVFVSQLLAGQSLLFALEATSANASLSNLAPFDFNTWLTQAVQNGQLLGARLL
jgi:hypothetical protein